MLRSPSYKNLVAFLVDAALIFTVSVVGFFFRLGSHIYEHSGYVLNHSILFTLVTCVVFWFFKVNYKIWRYFNFSYLLDIIKAASVSILLFLLLSFIYRQLEGYPRSVIFINWFLLIFFISLPRALYRSYHDKSFLSFFKRTNTGLNPILIAGISASTEAFIREINKSKDITYKVVGIIDKKSNINRLIYDVPVLGTLDDLEKVILKLGERKVKIARILISTELYLAGQLQQLLVTADKFSIPISRIPKITELQHNPKTALPIQPIPIEELLQRSQRILNVKSMQQLIRGKKVLITGAGGSIGSEIVRQVSSFSPKGIYLLDSSEFLLYEIEQECVQKFPGVPRQVLLSDIRDSEQILEEFKKYKPDIVFHAAALKHVPLLEQHKGEAVKTNIIGTKNVVDACLAANVKKFVMISTDKAVNPSSFMGATKRFAEVYCQSVKDRKMQISIVRFGNVLGSNGSVVPLFEKQIAAGGPITITHVEATRYFMTIKEAVGLVIQASALNEDNRIKIYVLDMGEPIKILELANNMIMLAGLKSGIDIEVKVIGLRPGERLHETLVSEHEELKNTVYNDIYLAHPTSVSKNRIAAAIEELSEACKVSDQKACVKIVYDIIADCNGKKLKKAVGS